MRKHGAIIENMGKKPKPDDKTQSKRFVDKAKELGVDEGGKSFLRAFKNIFSIRFSRHK